MRQHARKSYHDGRQFEPSALRPIGQDATQRGDVRFRDLVNQLDRAVAWECDIASNKFTFVSDRAEVVTGYAPQHWYGLDVWDFFAKHAHPDDRDRVLATMRSAIAECVNDRCDHRLICADGRIIWLYMGVHYDRRDGVLRGISVNINPNKRSEIACQQLADEYRTLAHSMPQIVWTARPDGTVDFVNKKLAEYLGKTAEEASKMTWTECLHPDDLPSTMALWMRSVITGEPFQDEHRIQGRDGEYRWFLVRGAATRGDDGRVCKWFGTCTDVDEAKRLEQRLRLSEQRFRTLVLGASQVIWTLSATGGVVEEQPSWEAFTGQTREEYMGYGWLKAVHPDDRERAYRKWEADREAGKRCECDYRLRRADGTYIWMTAFAIPSYDEETGKVHEWVGMTMDVTAVKDAELDLRDARRQAEAETRAREELMAIISHDLKNPLHAVVMNIGLLRQGANLPKKECFERLERGTAALNRLLNDLVDFSGVRCGQLRVKLGRLSLARLVEEAVENYQAEAAEGKICLTWSVPEVELRGDGGRLNQLLSNLISNALKFTPSGGRIEIGADVKSEVITLRVRDTGKGIPPDLLPHIFDRYWQAPATADGGRGLGLYICKGIAEAHGGRIRVESEVGKGTTFTLSLPRKGDAEQLTE